MLLKLIWQPDMSMLAIRVELEYRSVSKSLSRWGYKWESNAPIAAESEVTNFLRLLKLIWRSDSSMIAIAAGGRGHRFLLWMKLSCCLVWSSHAMLIGLEYFLLRWWHVACWPLNTHWFWSVSPDLSRGFAPAIGLCLSLGWSGVRLDEEEPDFIIVDLLIIE
jgi:hypothetical protein